MVLDRGSPHFELLSTGFDNQADLLLATDYPDVVVLLEDVSKIRHVFHLQVLVLALSQSEFDRRFDTWSVLVARIDNADLATTLFVALRGLGFAADATRGFRRASRRYRAV